MSIIIGLCGEGRAGKDTIADMLVKNYNFTKASFADPLKRGCMEIFGFTTEQAYGNLKEVEDPYWGFTPRWALQFVGTNLFRNWKEDMWVSALEKKIVSNPDVTRWVIPDCRFKNEKAAIERIGGEVWRVIREGGPGASGGLAAHPSEEELKTIPLEDFKAVISVPTGIPRLLHMATAKYLACINKEIPLRYWQLLEKYHDDPISLSILERVPNLHGQTEQFVKLLNDELLPRLDELCRLYE